MIGKYLLLALPLMLSVPGTASAAKKKQKTHFSLVEAYHRPQEGDPGNEPPMTGDHFVIRWNDTNYPETFFWRGENGWLSCKMERAHRTTKNGNFITETDGSPAHKGDTLMLSPVTGGRFPIPKEIPANAKNTLFYKTGGSGWLSFPVKKIVKK